MIARRALFALIAAALSLPVFAGPEQTTATGQALGLSVPAAKIDSGLGELASFETWCEPWLYATPAESLDSGLGELPPYGEWRYTWMYAMPAEKIDSGLGEIRPITTSGTSALSHRTIQ